MNRIRAFTLVELLIVIGVIAILIGILLPVLHKARDQANAVACQSNERQFYSLMTEYADDYNQYVIPASFKTNILGQSQLYWWSPLLIGQELGHNDLSSNASRQSGVQAITTFLTCPSADHSLDPTPTAAGHNYYGDYTYNENLGFVDLTVTPNIVTAPLEKLNRVPGNVIVLTDIDKTYCENDTSFTNGSYLTNISMFLEMNYLLGNHSTWPAQPPAIWFPHSNGSQANVLFEDGHVVAASPNDFVMPNSGGSINVKTIPWTYTLNGAAVTTTLPTKDWMVGYYKASLSPPSWQTPWLTGASSIP